jgi:hypothetical protein
MSEYTLVDCDTGLIYGPYESCEIAQAHAEAEALTTWEIVRDDVMLIHWSYPTQDVGELPKREAA